MSVFSNLSASWFALKAAGMLSAASWTPQGGGTATPADVIFDAPGTTILDDVVSTEPSVRFRSVDWAGIHERDTVAIGVDKYRVQRVTPLDDGATSRAMLALLQASS